MLLKRGNTEISCGQAQGRRSLVPQGPSKACHSGQLYGLAAPKPSPTWIYGLPNSCKILYSIIHRGI